MRQQATSCRRFQSTLPARGATVQRTFMSAKDIHFNPRSPRGERQCHRPAPVRSWSISIHAPREGSDGSPQRLQKLHQDFNPRSPRGERRHPHGPGVRHDHISIHAPREGSDTRFSGVAPAIPKFQSTLPARGATGIGLLHATEMVISIHAPREGSDDYRFKPSRISGISIHAPREGSDTGTPMSLLASMDFNPRSPRGERRLKNFCKSERRRISIHAPREGSDP